MVLGKWPNGRTILFCVFILILYVFRATPCSSSGESILSIQSLVYVSLCRWPFHVQVGKEFSDLHMKRSPTQSDIYQMLYWYNWFSWWWARGCSKHVQNWNIYTEKNCSSSWSFTKNHTKKYNCFRNCKNSHIRHLDNKPLLKLSFIQNYYICVTMDLQRYNYYSQYNTECFTTLGHNCRRWFPRSLW